MRLLKNVLSFIFLLYLGTIYSQVGINTITPSTAAVLHLEAQKIPTTEFGGFLMPIVTEAQQLLIPVSTVDASDDGLMVYVSDSGTGKQCWDIYDGVQHVWRSINCVSADCNSDILYTENFNSYLPNTGVTGASSINGNYPAGVNKWSLTSFLSFTTNVPALPGLLIDENDFAKIEGGRMSFRDTNGPLRFSTQPIDISGYSNIMVSMDIDQAGDNEYKPNLHINDFNCGKEESDYVDIEYSTDGGLTYTEVPNYLGNGTPNHTIADVLNAPISVSFSGISGTSLILRVRVQNWAADEYWYLDNILVQCN